MKQPYLIQQLLDAAEAVRNQHPALDEALRLLEDVQVTQVVPVELVMAELNCTREQARKYLHDAMIRMDHNDFMEYLPIYPEFNNGKT